MHKALLLGLVLGLTGVGAVVCGVHLHSKLKDEDSDDTFNDMD